MFALVVMRAFAILAISNSHLRELHPYPFLATGGMLGNTAFFFVSGFGITLGIRSATETFGSWYQRRLVRIYEPLVVVTLLFLIIGFRKADNTLDVFRMFVYPMEFWFIPVIACFYIPAYLLARYAGKVAFIIALGCLVATYLLLYFMLVDLTKWNVEDHVIVKSVYYFVPMLIGIYVAKFHASFAPSGRGLSLFTISTFLFFFFLIAMQRWALFRVQGLAEVFALLWTLSFYFMLRHHGNIEWVKSKTRLARGIEFVSAITLQMYLLGEFIFTRPFLKVVPYPANVLLFFILLGASAWLLSKISVAPLIAGRKLRPNMSNM